MKLINFEELIPSGVLFSIKDINNMGIIKSDMLRKLIYNRAITVVKIGSKNFIARDTLISYLEANTVPAELDMH
ncbi:DNA-binding protein [Sulfurimonas sp.]|uniref:DNA-binding protein n=1 Tax=Sulfurimonas sp. TaxID=2022749 RepID=UPI00261DC298|nr:DNA-binding protein [Sulfurimonas sp.]MCW8895003.1 DNA-binding protein [Sulfurimonas sp.]